MQTQNPLHRILLLALLIISTNAFTQPAGYYNGTEGKYGNELKTVLHEIIDEHIDYSSSYAKYIINYSDADPNNENNVILFYTQVSRNASNYGSGGNYINREHVWAKSHGNFSGIRPMDGDAHNLRPADASVNEDRGNRDFDYSQQGLRHYEATQCYYTDSTWEPGPATKGQVARILFYMATRYEGTNDEMDLELVARNNTYPQPLHGNLTALLEWNEAYPPSDLERQRNERIFRIQGNRNPFVDHPEYANYIWGNQQPEGFELGNFSMQPQFPEAGQQVTLSFKLKNNFQPEQVKLYWGPEFDSQANSTDMTANGNSYSANITLPSYNPTEMVYFKIVVSNSEYTQVLRADYLIPEPQNSLQLTAIENVQGSGFDSPMLDQVVTIRGIVTANFDGSYYLQSSNNKRNGVCVYGALPTGKTGEELVVRGTVTEYETLTEIKNVTYVYNYGGNTLIEPVEIDINQIGEDYEGMLVKIKGVYFNDGGKTVTDQNNSYTFSNQQGSAYIFSRAGSRLVGHQLPAQKVDLVGIVSQYKGGYQILPRDINDFKLSTGLTAATAPKTEIKVFPIPAQKILNVATAQPFNSVKIYNTTGVLTLLDDSKQQTIDVSILKPGVYILQVEFSNRSNSFARFVKSE